MRDAVVAVARRELGAAPDAVEGVAEGLQHESVRLTVDGRAYVLQFAGSDDGREADSLARGLHWYGALRDSPVPVPRVVTESVAEHEGRAYTLVEAIPGETGERAVSPARTRNAAGVLAEIHDHTTFENAGWLAVENDEVAVRRSGDDDEASFRDWMRQKGGEAAEILEDAGMRSVADDLERVTDECGDLLPTAVDPVLCHGDYSPDNVMFDGDRVVGVLDFDRARAGRAEWDLAMAASAFWMHDPTADWDVRAAFYDGYRATRPVANAFERREPLFRAVTLATLVAGMLELDALSEYEHDFYEARLRATVQRAAAARGE